MGSSESAWGSSSRVARTDRSMGVGLAETAGGEPEMNSLVRCLPSAALVAALCAACFSEAFGPAPDGLAVGTWGGDGAGVIVSDTIAHVHVGCTFGNFDVPVALDGEGRFETPGSYILRAYPI